MKKAISLILLIAALLACFPAAADGFPRDANVIGTVIIANGDSARVRAASNAESEQIGLVNPGEQYDCVGIAPNGWYEIAYPTGQTGFISNKLAVLKNGMLSDSTFSYPVGSVYISHTADVRTRNGGGGDYAFMGSVHPGQTFPCVGISATGWYAILLDNGWIAYVSDALTSLQPDAYITPNPIPQSAILAGATVSGIVTITNNANVNVRAGGSTDYPVVTQVRPGEMFSYAGKFDGSGWLGIILWDGYIGYIAPSMAEVTRK